MLDQPNDRQIILQEMIDLLKQQQRRIEQNLLVTRVLLGASLAIFAIAIFNVFF